MQGTPSLSVEEGLGKSSTFNQHTFLIGWGFPCALGVVSLFRPPSPNASSHVQSVAWALRTISGKGHPFSFADFDVL